MQRLAAILRREKGDGDEEVIVFSFNYNLDPDAGFPSDRYSR